MSGRAVVAALALLAAAITPPAAAEAGPARERLDRTLRTLRDARATFTQTRTSSILGAPLRPSTGRLEFRAPRLLRLSFAGAAPTTILVRGDTAWIDQPAGRQVIRTSARASGAPPLPFLEESVAVLEKSYVIVETGPRALTLTPRAEGVPWRAIDLVLDARSGMPSRVVIRQNDDEEIRLDFGRWTLNGGVAATRFAPVFATGSRIVEL